MENNTNDTTDRGARKRSGGKEVKAGEMWVSVRIPERVLADVKDRAKKIDRSASWLMRQYIILGTEGVPEGPTK